MVKKKQKKNERFPGRAEFNWKKKNKKRKRNLWIFFFQTLRVQSTENKSKTVFDTYKHTRVHDDNQ